VSDGPWLVVGLGNPGPGYAGNRHNVGAMVLEVLAGRLSGGGALKAHRSRAMVAEGRLGPLPGERVVLVRPTAYMNESGGQVAGALQFFKVGPERLLVIHDELDIPYGDVRLKLGGGEGGHNGLRSISRSIGTKDYLRARFGIGRPPGRMDPAAFVLRDFAAAERKDLPVLLEETADAVEVTLTDGLAVAQNRFHPAPEARPGPPRTDRTSS
jgi:PTH1 family peptidyl-tRNA hydrolase